MSTTPNGPRHHDSDPADWSELRIDYSPAQREADAKLGRAAATWMPADPRSELPPDMRAIVLSSTLEWQQLGQHYVDRVVRLGMRRCSLEKLVAAAETDVQLRASTSTSTSTAANGANGRDEFAAYDAARARGKLAADRAALAECETAVQAAPWRLERARDAMAAKLLWRLSIFTTALVKAHKHGNHLRQPLERALAELYLEEMGRLGAAARRLLELLNQRELPAADDEED